jgi:hypothetical protein
MAWADQAALGDPAKTQIGLLVRASAFTGDDVVAFTQQEDMHAFHKYAEDCLVGKLCQQQDFGPARIRHLDRKHKRYTSAASRTMTRIGVGLKPLQGLFTCGQLEITNSTSISAVTST